MAASSSAPHILPPPPSPSLGAGTRAAHLRPLTPPEAVLLPAAPCCHPTCEPPVGPAPGLLQQAPRAPGLSRTATPLGPETDHASSQPGLAPEFVSLDEVTLNALQSGPPSFSIPSFTAYNDVQASSSVSTVPSLDQAKMELCMPNFPNQCLSSGRSSSIVSDTATSLFSSLSFDLSLDPHTRRGSAPTFHVSHRGPAAWSGGAHHRASLAGPLPTSMDPQSLGAAGAHCVGLESPPRKKRLSSLDPNLVHALSAQRPGDAAQCNFTNLQPRHTTSMARQTTHPAPRELGRDGFGAHLPKSALGHCRFEGALPFSSSRPINACHQEQSAPTEPPLFQASSVHSELQAMPSWGLDASLDPLSPPMSHSSRGRIRATSSLSAQSELLSAPAFGTASIGPVAFAPHAAGQEMCTPQTPSAPDGMSLAFSAAADTRWGETQEEADSEHSVSTDPSGGAYPPSGFSLRAAPPTGRRNSNVPPVPAVGPKGSVDLESKTAPALGLPQGDAGQDVWLCNRFGEGVHQSNLGPSNWPPLGPPPMPGRTPSPLIPSSRLRTLPARASADNAAQPHVIPCIPRQASLPSHINMEKFPLSSGANGLDDLPPGTAPAPDYTLSTAGPSGALLAPAALGGAAPRIAALDDDPHAVRSFEPAAPSPGRGPRASVSEGRDRSRGNPTSPEMDATAASTALSAHAKGKKGTFSCDYTHPLTGEVCRTKCNRYYDLARHRESIHAKSEAQMVREARIGLAQCRVLGREVDMRRTFSTGDHVCDGAHGCGTVFSRRDALQRHRRLRRH